MISIRANGFRLNLPWRAVWLLLPLLFGDLAVSHHTLISGQAWAQTSTRGIGMNPDYPSPDDQTPAGIEVTSTTLVENATGWNRRIIGFKGEAIGERMARGGMAWIHLNDDAYMEKSIEAGAGSEGYNSGQAIWLSSDLARRIQFFGDYKTQGDLVRITGVFNAACSEHGGDMDIHATDLTVVAIGHPVTHEIKTPRALLAAGLMLSSVLLFWIRRRARNRRIGSFFNANQTISISATETTA
jgi:hypothetical protein